MESRYREPTKTNAPTPSNPAHKPQPSLGRIVHFSPAARPGEVWAAVIAKVQQDGSLNLGGFDENGHTFAVQSVAQAPDGAAAGTEPARGFWCWPAPVGGPGPTGGGGPADGQPTPRPSPTGEPPPPPPP
jgi:hypothetical protein